MLFLGPNEKIPYGFSVNIHGSLQKVLESLRLEKLGGARLLAILFLLFFLIFVLPFYYNSVASGVYLRLCRGIFHNIYKVFLLCYVMDMSQLEKIGLKEKEARVYVALLKKGETLANQLAKETNILRSSIYDYLDILLEKGFASYVVKSGKKYFHAVDPKKILDNFEEAKKREEVALKDIVPKLMELQDVARKGAHVEVFEGKEGMKTVFSRILKDGPKEILVYGSSGVAHKLLPFYMEHWHKQRIKQKIKIKIIYNKVAESRERIKSGPSVKLMDIKFLPIENVSLTGTMIYNDKILILMLNPESSLAISIESADISKQYTDNFGVLWKGAKK